MTTNQITKSSKTFQGVVVSAKMQKTVVVAVKRYMKHPKYQKYILRTKRFLAHDESGSLREGEAVVITETRPLSRHKSFIATKA